MLHAHVSLVARQKHVTWGALFSNYAYLLKRSYLVKWLQSADIVAYAQCWDVLRFGNCVQHFVGRVRHVADLAHLLSDEMGGAGDLQPQREQCHLAMLRIAKCASIAARPVSRDVWIVIAHISIHRH